MTGGTMIATEKDLRSLYAPAKERAVKKQLTSLDHHCKRFVALSPFVVLATSEAWGAFWARLTRGHAVYLPLVSMLLAGDYLVRSHRSLAPLLMLDDVFSELDPFRSSQLLALLPPGQTLVTAASPLPAGLQPADMVDVTMRNT